MSNQPRWSSSAVITNLFATLVTILPFVFCWLNDELFEFNKMLVVYGFTILIGGTWIAQMIVRKKINWQRTPLDLPLLLFFLSQLISTLFSLHPRTSWLGYYTRLNGGLLSTISYLVLYYSFVNNVDRKGRKKILTGLLISSILVSLYAILEHFGFSFSCLIIKGQFDVTCWVQDVQTRVFASFGQPNWLAAFNVTIIGLTTCLLMIPRQRRETILLASATYANFVALLFTKSRSGILAFFLGLVMTIIGLALVWQRQHQSSWRRLAFILLGFLIPALIWGTQYTPSFTSLITKVKAEELIVPAHLQQLNLQVTDSADIRKIVWQGALDIWHAHPIFGTGVETFAYSYYNFRPADHNWTSEWDFLYNKAHNELLNYLANSGLVGLLTYLSIFIVFGLVIIKKMFDHQQPLDQQYQLIGLASGLFALSITNFFGFSTVTVQVLLFIYLAYFSQLIIRPTIDATKDELKVTWPLLFLTGGIIYLLSQVAITWLADYNYAHCKTEINQTANSSSLVYCQRAIQLRPREAIYLLDLADYYAQYAVALQAQDPGNEQINTVANQSLALSQQALKLNPVNLNFYKTNFRILSTLAKLDENAYLLAKVNLETAIALAPTDPKLAYYYGVLLQTLGQVETGYDWIEKAVTLRPLYLEARITAAQTANYLGKLDRAAEHYQFVLDYLDANNSAAQTGLAQLATMSGIISPNE